MTDNDWAYPVGNEGAYLERDDHADCEDLHLSHLQSLPIIQIVNTKDTDNGEQEILDDRNDDIASAIASEY